MKLEKLISIFIMGSSILLIFLRPFGAGIIIDDYYRTPPWQELVYLFIFVYGLSMYPTTQVQSSNKTGEKE